MLQGNQSRPGLARVSPGEIYHPPDSLDLVTLAAGGQSKPRLARVEPWSRATKVGQSWPGSALVSSGVKYIIVQVNSLCLYKCTEYESTGIQFAV